MTYENGQAVEIVGPDYAGDSDDLGKLGVVVRYRGGGQYWVRFADNTGTTFDATSLHPLDGDSDLPHEVFTGQGYPEGE